MKDDNLEFILVNNYKCKRCGCINYDKVFYTGDKMLGDENAIQEEHYICRNCDFPFDITKYKKQNSYNMSSKELLDESVFINENKKENNNE